MTRQQEIDRATWIIPVALLLLTAFLWWVIGNGDGGLGPGPSDKP